MTSINRLPLQSFTGIEVENTPFKGEPTLFVAYHYQPKVFLRHIQHDLQTKGQNVRHVYLGANQIYERKPFWSEHMDCLLEVIPQILAEGLSVTLDIPAHAYARLNIRKPLVAQVFSSSATCLLLSVPVLNANLMPNVSLKLDDAAGVGGPNGGVWTTTRRDIELSGGFTPWSAYKDDKD